MRTLDIRLLKEKMRISRARPPKKQNNPNHKSGDMAKIACYNLLWTIRENTDFEPNPFLL
ncbi:hypothetical protein DRO69_11060 [Candidatus Bathyarchaeota archaeon]|nr:MAG: hypothetical protein DRO69_11060 [Candidatus Bathyarchaeota archaeon]